MVSPGHVATCCRSPCLSTREPSIIVHVPAGHRLDNENDHKNRRNGIQWTLLSQLDDLDFADDLALLSHSHEQMQEKTDLLNLVSAQTGLNINMNKTKIMKANTKSKNVVTVGGEPLEETDCFTYLGSKIKQTGGTEEDTKARIQKARVAFLMLSKIWKSKLIKLKTKMRIFNYSVKSVLL